MGSDTNDPFSNLTRMWMEMAANAMQAWQPFGGLDGIARHVSQGPFRFSCKSGAIGASN